jgi:ribosomal-protein-alanine N-acetyltransferase
MTERDIESVLSIERSVFKHPWSCEFFRLILADMNNCVLTLKDETGIIGYGGFHLLKNKVNFLGADVDYNRIIHLINIAIEPHEQHRGFGTYLLNILMGRARASSAEYCYLEVRLSNQKAFTFYRKCGFQVIGIIDNYYPPEGENAIVMGRELKSNKKQPL